MVADIYFAEVKMFFKKKKEDYKLPDLPASRARPVLGPRISPPVEVDEGEEGEVHSLPAFPDSPTHNKFSQAAIKDAVGEDKHGEFSGGEKKEGLMELEEWQPSSGAKDDEFTCPECGEILEIKDSTELIDHIKNEINKSNSALVETNNEIKEIEKKELRAKEKRLRAEQKQKEEERKKKRKAREREKRKLEKTKHKTKKKPKKKKRTKPKKKKQFKKTKKKSKKKPKKKEKKHFKKKRFFKKKKTKKRR